MAEVDSHQFSLHNRSAKKQHKTVSHCPLISTAVQLSPCSWRRWCDRGSLPSHRTSSCSSSLDLPQPEQGRQGQPDKQKHVKFSFTSFILLAKETTHGLQPPLDGHQVRHPLVEPRGKVFRVDGHKTLTLGAQTSWWRCRKQRVVT